ncbi:prolyl oligopeptidase family protein [Belliella baltica DSM 15883]|uniref:Prolyl oligopeptidase family protein n=1 Tax=Belliella baltica (strain DSM 15883 / CIP 108006 / LMG 21964 / BA134) TaxID=866536 RepID=I3Z1B6_BELBD|nr:alpha/beta fold hydrolase [Belliella baltica]AFL83034.1 prolyl oligopeptidase family protein [Belliella baltica DSM 15883]
MKLSKSILCLLILISSITSVFAINPDREYIRTPDSLGLKFESVSVQTPDGFDIKAWIYSANESTDNGRLLILAYPDAGNMSYFVYQSAILSSQGFTVVTFDYRGFGKSSDFDIERNMLYYDEFVTDLISIGEFTKQNFPDKNIGIWGMSMGTIIAVKAMTSLKGKVDFLVTEGFITNTELIVERIFKDKELNISLPKNSTDYLKCLNDLSVPILIFSASKDNITPFEDALNFKRNRISGICEIVNFEGDRLSGFNFGDGEWGTFYINKINQFIDAAEA